jgi:hypothetical protein
VWACIPVGDVTDKDSRAWRAATAAESCALGVGGDLSALRRPCHLEIAEAETAAWDGATGARALGRRELSASDAWRCRGRSKGRYAEAAKVTVRASSSVG